MPLTPIKTTASTFDSIGSIDEKKIVACRPDSWDQVFYEMINRYEPKIQPQMEDVTRGLLGDSFAFQPRTKEELSTSIGLFNQLKDNADPEMKDCFFKEVIKNPLTSEKEMAYGFRTPKGELFCLTVPYEEFIIAQASEPTSKIPNVFDFQHSWDKVFDAMDSSDEEKAHSDISEPVLTPREQERFDAFYSRLTKGVEIGHIPSPSMSPLRREPIPLAGITRNFDTPFFGTPVLTDELLFIHNQFNLDRMPDVISGSDSSRFTPDSSEASIRPYFDDSSTGSDEIEEKRE